MAHSAEDITVAILERDYHYRSAGPLIHSDVRHGFVINFPQRPDIDIDELEEKVKAIIKADVPISQVGEEAIQVGDIKIYCTGPRTHVHHSGEIEISGCSKNFALIPRLTITCWLAWSGKRLLLDLKILSNTWILKTNYFRSGGGR